MPLVSVILNSYNQSKYLPEAVESVLGQTYTDFELIAIDNGSTDDSQDVFRRYESHPKVRLFLHNENTAITRRFNQGIAAARGDFIAFLYSDDYFLPNKLERQVACFAGLSPDYGVVYGPAMGHNDVSGRKWTNRSIGASGNILADMLLRAERGHIDMTSPLTRKQCLERYPFYEDIFAEGEGIYFRLAMTYKFFYLDEPLCVNRDHMNNAGKAIKRNAEMTMRMLERLEAHPDLPPDHRRSVRRFRAKLYRNYGWQTIRVGGDAQWARASFLNAVRSGCSDALHVKVFAGLGLSLLPRSLRARLNSVGDAISKPLGNSVYVEDFGGSIDRA